MAGKAPRRSGGKAKGGRGAERKPFLLRLPPDVMEELRTWSASEFRSLNAHLEYLLREALRRRGRKGGEGD